MARFTGLLGLLVFLSLAYAFSTNRRAIRWRTVAWGLGLQVLFAFAVIKWNTGQIILRNVSGFITGLLGHAADGSGLVFGYLGIPSNPLSVFAFSVLPTIIFVSAFFAILYHIGLMQQIIKIVAYIMQFTMGTSGAESTNVAASIFMGQTEAPLTIRPFLDGATPLRAHDHHDLRHGPRFQAASWPPTSSSVSRQGPALRRHHDRTPAPSWSRRC